MLLLCCGRDFDILGKHFYLPGKYVFISLSNMWFLWLCFCILGSTLTSSVLGFWPTCASRIRVLKYFPLSGAWIMVESHVTLFVRNYAFSLPRLDIRSWHWVICTLKSAETASLLLEVSGSERFGFRLTVPKHQPSWSVFLMFFPGRQWDLCSFRIVFQIHAFSPSGSAGTFKK